MTTTLLESRMVAAVLGLRFIDYATGLSVDAGIRATAVPTSQPDAAVHGVAGPSGIVSFHELSGLRDLEFPAVDSEPTGPVSFPSSVECLVMIDDVEERFLPAIFGVQLPLDPTGTALPLLEVPVFSAPTRPVTRGFGAMRADLRDVVTGEPVPYAVLRVDVGGVSGPFKFKNDIVIIKVLSRDNSQLPQLGDVHDELLQKEKLPPSLVTKGLFEDRFDDIRHFERYLTRNGVVVRKFFLHISKKEQKKRFLERLDNPKKHWKFEAGDVLERERWDDYIEAYEDMIRHTATKHAPWYVVPADNKWFTRVVVAAAIIDALASLELHYPEVSPERLKELAAAKRALLGKT